MATTTTQKVGEVKDKVQETAHNVADKAKEIGSAAMDKAKDLGSAAMDKAKDIGSSVAKTADNAAASVGENMKSAAGTIKEYAPKNGMLKGAADAVADSVEHAGEYLTEQGVTGAAEDFTKLIKRNPIPAVLIGIGVGFLLARATSRS